MLVYGAHPIELLKRHPVRADLLLDLSLIDIPQYGTHIALHQGHLWSVCPCEAHAVRTKHQFCLHVCVSRFCLAPPTLYSTLCLRSLNTLPENMAATEWLRSPPTPAWAPRQL